jgi:hypothetical protein
MIDAQSKALIALGRMAPGLAEWVVGKVAG